MKKLGKNEAGLKLDDKGKVTLAMPKFQDDDDVPDYVQLIMAIAVLIKSKDEGFFDYVYKRWDEIVGEEKKESGK